ncbi:MAG: SDR family NAD(P)-dependent oxidoreductase [Candidatus Heimdallarchaeota archaeon]|nr:SDR family NAD(P)-dependent oxidoreductase [Candidatus Heimdallarchaeota archaeon]
MKVLITGTNRGLGLEFVKQYLERGEEVIAACRNPEKAKELHQLQKKHGDKLMIIPLELTDQKSINNAYKLVKERFNALDLLINNAGIASGGEKNNYTIGELHKEDMTKVFQVNAISPALIVEKFLKIVEEGENPKIVNITSALGSIGSKRWVFRYSYCASKAALNMFSMLLSLELKDKGIIVIPLHPGHVRTDLGGASARLSPKESISGMIEVIDSLTIEDTGKFLSWDGKELPW